MKKFMAIYMAPVAAYDEMMKNMSPEQSRQQMEVWRKWMESKKSFMADGGAPLGKNKRVNASGISDVRNEMGGYTIVQAETHDEAAKIFSDNPMMQTPSSYVEVMEIMPM